MKSIEKNFVHVIGGGLAGSEAAYFLAERGIPVKLSEMRPVQKTEAHHSDKFAELVCSNSLKSKAPDSAPGMLKTEMTSMNSLILKAAQEAAVPGGEALAVDREVFSEIVTKAIQTHALIECSRQEVTKPFNDQLTLIATGPLTSQNLSNWIAQATSQSELYFYDAIAPIVDTDSIDMNDAFLANRYDKGDEAAYLNCPMTKEEYELFIDALLKAEKVAPKNFEKAIYFQGCQPIETIAESGRESLRFGPMKPVGLRHPQGKPMHAVVQLRPENRSKTAYNLVGFQTKLKYGEQAKIFRMIPALKNAEFLRLGSIHRNTYVNTPSCLRADLSIKKNPLVYLAGQITGVEGYLESAACGMLAAVFIEQRFRQLPFRVPPANTALGSLLAYLTQSDPKNFQPGNIHFGLFDPAFFDIPSGTPKDLVRKKMAEQSRLNFLNWSHSEKLKNLTELKTETQSQLVL